jgi:hypothetical protein
MAKFAERKLVGRNHQYAGPTDGLRNLRHCEAFDVPTEMGIIVRMADKMQRIYMECMSSAVLPADLGSTDNGLDNNDLPDLVNYALLLYAVRVIRQDAATMDALEKGGR